MVAEVTTTKEYFATLPERFNAAAVERSGLRYRFIVDGRQAFLVSVGRESVTVKEAERDLTALVTLNIAEAQLLDAANGRVTFAGLHQRGALKVEGDANALKQLQAIFPGRRA